MKAPAIICIIILFSNCTKKSLPNFQNTIQKSYLSKNSMDENELAANEILEDDVSHNQEITSSSTNAIFVKEDLPKESQTINVVERKTIQPKFQKKGKLNQVLKTKQSHFEEKPKYEKLGNAASIFGTFALVLILITIFLAFTSEYVLLFWFPTLIFANIALILGAVSVKKIVKKQKARFAIVVGLIWDVLLLAFIGWLVFR